MTDPTAHQTIVSQEPKPSAPADSNTSNASRGEQGSVSPQAEDYHRPAEDESEQGKKSFGKKVVKGW
jgi:hypothetical protein